MKNTKTSKWTLWLAVVALALAMVASLNFSTSVSASGGNDLGTSPFDFSDATYRAHPSFPKTSYCALAPRLAPVTSSSTTPTPIRTVQTSGPSKPHPAPRERVV